MRITRDMQIVLPDRATQLTQNILCRPARARRASTQPLSRCWGANAFVLSADGRATQSFSSAPYIRDGAVGRGRGTGETTGAARNLQRGGSTPAQTKTLRRSPQPASNRPA